MHCDEADIQFGFDNLAADRRLERGGRRRRPSTSIAATTVGAAAAGAIPMYTNYAHYIERAEVRIFEPSSRSRPSRSV